MSDGSPCAQGNTSCLSTGKLWYDCAVNRGFFSILVLDFISKPQTRTALKIVILEVEVYLYVWLGISLNFKDHSP